MGRTTSPIMATPRFLASLQKQTGTTRSEAITVLSIALVIAAGTVGPWIFGGTPLHDVATADRILAMLDSSANAASVEQGQRIVEPHAPDADRQRSSKASEAVAPRRGAVNINLASAAQLERLPGVGPATAEAIVKRRNMRPFMNVDDLMDIRGIGSKKLEKMRPYVTCGK